MDASKIKAIVSGLSEKLSRYTADNKGEKWYYFAFKMKAY